MTNLNVPHWTVTLPGVTHRHDLHLHSLWTAYAYALGPFDFCLPDDSTPESRPNVHSELGFAHLTLRRVREFVSSIRDHSEFSRCTSQWLTAVDACGGWHGIRQPFLPRLGKLHPIVPLSAEALMRARVDDSMMALESPGYRECYSAVLSDLLHFLVPSQVDELRNHCLRLASIDC